MAANLEDQLIDKGRALPPDKQREAFRLLDSLATDDRSDYTTADRRAIWEVVDEINAGLPADTWENVPTDGSINLDHYLYGAPKQQSCKWLSSIRSTLWLSSIQETSGTSAPSLLADLLGTLN